MYIPGLRRIFATGASKAFCGRILFRPFIVYSQRFTPVPGCKQRELERRGFIALGRIEDYSAGVVFRHEQTLAKPKADRLDLLRATRAHFGQIFVVYEDSGQVESLLATNADPDISGLRTSMVWFTGCGKSRIRPLSIRFETR